MAPWPRYLSRLCWLMRQGAPVSDVLVYVPERGRSRSDGDGGRWVARPWREARKVVGDDVIRAIRQGGWDFDLVDDAALAVLPAERIPPGDRHWCHRLVGRGPGVVRGVCRRGRHRDHGGFRRGPCRRDGLWPGRPRASCRRSYPADVRIAPAPRSGWSSADRGRRRLFGDQHRTVGSRVHPRGGPQPVRGVGRPDRSVVRAGHARCGVEVRLHPYQGTVIVMSDQKAAAARGRGS